MADENKGMLADLQAWLGVFPADLTKHMDKMQEHLANVGNCLLAMENGDSTSNKEDASATAVAKAKLECDTTAKDLEEDTCNGSHGL